MGLLRCIDITNSQVPIGTFRSSTYDNGELREYLKAERYRVDFETTHRWIWKKKARRNADANARSTRLFFLHHRRKLREHFLLWTSAFLFRPFRRYTRGNFYVMSPLFLLARGKCARDSVSLADSVTSRCVLSVRPCDQWTLNLFSTINCG
mgnify:CR=1 FL=1